MNAPSDFRLDQETKAIVRSRTDENYSRDMVIDGVSILSPSPPSGTSPSFLPGSMSAEGGRKDDNGKPRMDLIPPEVMFALGTVLGFGAQKYAARNWEQGMSWGRVFGALMRHLWAWWGGRGPTSNNFAFGDLDAETGFSHLWHALCCVAFLVAYEERGAGEDDRLKL